MEKDSFKQIYETEAPEALKECSLRNIKGSVRSVRSALEVLDVYITKFFDALVSVFQEKKHFSAGGGFGMEFDGEMQTPFNIPLEELDESDGMDDGDETPGNVERIR